ncbi:two-component system sensor histidine kinase MtrB [Allocatelliglobosispora scoriae]|uniref:Sensor histidine kinase MtrB n=1 Tax=Allocatelliglobosispora scoriae TaxID=643052 RepID=A0A841BS61_9ACTN|nr:MtrAB system histidine kinase MtrB [Allocatelliglobosispora scoriae]MBB5870236.1 two-component system sensor histidine kinase MtrB [Allocatelliglobosispora scoriae]
MTQTPATPSSPESDETAAAAVPPVDAHAPDGSLSHLGRRAGVAVGELGRRARRGTIQAVKRVVAASGPLGSRIAPALTVAHRSWRRSLQIRMITITVITSGVLVGGFSFLIAERSTTALVAGTTSSVKAQLESGAGYAQDQLNNYSRWGDPGVNQTVDDILGRLRVTPEQGGGVVVAMMVAQDPMAGIFKSTAAVDVNSGNAISTELREAVTAGQLAHEIVSADITPDDNDHSLTTYLVFGRGVETRWGPDEAKVQIYYLVPLTTQERIADTFRTTIAAFAVLLVLVLTLVVSLVIRLVVNPVRIAARTAQRLSAGLLDQRMEVNGEDDLALLATAFNQMAANLQRQIVRLEEMSRLQRRFTSDVSHELRTPLTTVRMAADLIYGERDELDPALARSAELLQHELDRFESLLTDLLEISRFDAGFAMLDLEPTDLVPIVARVVDRLGSVAARAGIQVEIVTPEPPVIAEIDPRRVERVLRNLVGNAVEHGEGRPVVVTLGASEGAVAITVRDLGVGLKPGEEKLVFNRFWRADPSRARQTGGTGLGLSIAAEDAKLHGGWLEAWGKPGEGAQFRLTLPVRAGDRIREAPLPLAPQPALPAQREESEHAEPEAVTA